jgi:hypothetical protein
MIQALIGISLRWRVTVLALPKDALPPTLYVHDMRDSFKVSNVDTVPSTTEMVEFYPRG